MKVNESSVVTARSYIEYLVDKKNLDLNSVPRIAVIVYSNKIAEYFESRYVYSSINIGTRLESTLKLYRGKNNNYTFCILNGSIGAPMAAINTEELAAMGVKNIIAAGPAGYPIKRNIDNKELDNLSVFNVCCAHSYEGTTSHYYKNKNYYQPCSKLSYEILRAAHALNMRLKEGVTATTDAIYRETPSFVSKIVDQGCNLVDMECSAIFGVAQFRNISAAAILYHTDVVSTEDDRWHVNDDQFIQETEISVAKIIEKFINEQN
jgi:uridine phosphorylase